MIYRNLKDYEQTNEQRSYVWALWLLYRHAVSRRAESWCSARSPRALLLKLGAVHGCSLAGSGPNGQDSGANPTPGGPRPISVEQSPGLIIGFSGSCQSSLLRSLTRRDAICKTAKSIILIRSSHHHGPSTQYVETGGPRAPLQARASAESR